MVFHEEVPCKVRDGHAEGGGPRIGDEHDAGLGAGTQLAWRTPDRRCLEWSFFKQPPIDEGRDAISDRGAPQARTLFKLGTRDSITAANQAEDRPKTVMLCAHASPESGLRLRVASLAVAATPVTRHDSPPQRGISDVITAVVCIRDLEPSQRDDVM